ncbi:MAG: hypothetical protein QOI98_2534 [Solirubrobacteraceae bacterium]|nr:hypothetical protein [Solirubrobacteraceae bacterium]
MTRPEEALAKAREAAAQARSEGGYADDLHGLQVEPTDAVTIDKLLEWALIEPDARLVRSTRALGAPITWTKRLLVRALRQHLAQIVSQQTRFNIQLTAFIAELDDRVTRLEKQAGGRPPADI